MDSSSNEKIKRYMKEEGIHYVPVWRIFGFSGANMAVNLYMVEKEEGIPLGLSLLSILGRDKDRNPDFKMEDLNHALNQIKKY